MDKQQQVLDELRAIGRYIEQQRIGELESGIQTIPHPRHIIQDSIPDESDDPILTECDICTVCGEEQNA